MTNGGAGSTGKDPLREPRQHACAFFESSQELFQTVGPYLREGLDNGQRCLLVLDHDRVEQFLHDGGLGGDLKRHIDQRRLIPAVRFYEYLSGDQFDLENAQAFFRHVAEAALADGYDGVRLAGVTDWSQRHPAGPGRLIQMETRMGDWFGQCDTDAMCAFNLADQPPSVLLHALATHNQLMTDGQAIENPYCLPGETLESPAAVRSHVRRLLDLAGQGNPGGADGVLRLIEHLPETVLLCFGGDRTIFRIGGSELARHGLAPDDFLGKTVDEILPPESARPVQQALDQALAGEPARVEFSHHDQDYLLVAGPLNEPGAPAVSASAVVQNISRFTAEQRKLARSEAHLRHAMQIAGLGTWYWDAATDLCRWSPELCRVLGLDEHDNQRTTQEFFDLVHPDDRDRVERGVAEAMSNRATYEDEFRIVLPDGAERVVHSMAQAEVDPQGRLTHWIGMARDVTDNRRREQQESRLQQRARQLQKLESLGVLAGGIAHDFNNLLTGVLGNADLALMELPDAGPAREAVQAIRAATLKASELTGQMLAYSGRGRFVVTGVRLNDLLEQMRPLLSASISKKIALKLDLQADLPVVQADLSQMRQAVMNLLANAAEAVGEDEGTITIQTRRVQLRSEDLAECYAAEESVTPGPYARLRMTDTGCGMTASVRARAFEPFFTTRFVGRGLGLPAVLGIVRGHGGTMRLESRPGGGTTATIYLPIAPEYDREAPPEAPAEPMRIRAHVLVIDDELPVRKTVAAMLRAVGADVMTACDGLEGVDTFRRQAAEIDIVLLDLAMPRMDGGETLQRLRDIRPDVPVLLWSGYDQQQAMQRFGRPARSNFLQKPFSMDDLLKAVKNLIEA